MARRKQALTDAKIRKLKKPGRYTDGDGLDLVVTKGVEGVNLKWVNRLTINGKRRERGIGAYPHVSLAQARSVAFENRGIAREGKDPNQVRQETSAIPDFATAARKVHDLNKDSWRNAKHSAQWLRTLENYAVPYIGNMSVTDVETKDVLEALLPIWLTKQETARRVKQRIATVFDWCIVKGYRVHNPVIGVTRGLPKQSRKPKHMKAMPYSEVPAFVAWMRGQQPISDLALEFLILTAARTGEVVGMKWHELDLVKALWTIPAERTKTDVEHRVPLSERAAQILMQMQPLEQGTNSYVFPSPSKPGQPLSDGTMLAFLRRNGYSITSHGYRSSFRDWCAEQTGFPPAAVEKCLSHKIRNEAEAAYHRTDYLEKRREIMAAWAAYLDTFGQDQKVIQLRS